MLARSISVAAFGPSDREKLAELPKKIAECLGHTD